MCKNDQDNVAHGGSARQSLMDALVDIASFNKKNKIKYMHIKPLFQIWLQF